METQENPNTETPQSETSTTTTSETKPVAKNPWWVKAMPIVLIVLCLLRLAFIEYSIMTSVLIVIFLWWGIRIHKDKLILGKYSIIYYWFSTAMYGYYFVSTIIKMYYFK